VAVAQAQAQVTAQLVVEAVEVTAQAVGLLNRLVAAVAEEQLVEVGEVVAVVAKSEARCWHRELETRFVWPIIDRRDHGFN